MRKLIIILFRNIVVAIMSAPFFYFILGDVDSALECASIAFTVSLVFGYMIDYQIMRIK